MGSVFSGVVVLAIYDGLTKRGLTPAVVAVAMLGAVLVYMSIRWAVNASRRRLTPEAQELLDAMKTHGELIVVKLGKWHHVQCGDHRYMSPGVTSSRTDPLAAKYLLAHQQLVTHGILVPSGTHAWVLAPSVVAASRRA